MNAKQHKKIVGKLNGQISNQLGEIRNLKALVEDFKVHSSNMAEIGVDRLLELNTANDQLAERIYELKTIKNAPWTTRLKWLFTGVK